MRLTGNDMSKYSDAVNSMPQFPSETCPSINAVKKLDEIKDGLDALTGRRANLEELCEQNSQLRERDILARATAEEFSIEIDRLDALLEKEL